MMTSSNGNIFRVTGHLCGEFPGHRWIPRTKASDAKLWCFLWSAPWVNNEKTGDLKRHRAHYDVIVVIRVTRSPKKILLAITGHMWGEPPVTSRVPSHGVSNAKTFPCHGVNISEDFTWFKTDFPWVRYFWIDIRLCYICFLHPWWRCCLFNVTLELIYRIGYGWEWYIRYIHSFQHDSSTRCILQSLVHISDMLLSLASIIYVCRYTNIHIHIWYYIYIYIEREREGGGGSLPKGPYPPCLRMADRALLIGYPRYITCLKVRSRELTSSSKQANLFSPSWVKITSVPWAKLMHVSIKRPTESVANVWI